MRGRLAGAVRTSYDAAGQLTKVTEAWGTADQADEATNSYTLNGKPATLTDAENNRTTYEYDGHDRLLKLRFPVAAKGGLASSDSDYEQYGYDLNSNRTSLRNRAGETIVSSYDALNRETFRNLPNSLLYETDLTFGYDLMGRMTSASDHHGVNIATSYDALGRRTGEVATPYAARSFQYDQGGRRTRMTWKDGFYVAYDYLDTGEMARIRERDPVTGLPATAGAGVLATFAYDDLGRRTSLTRGNGTVATYGYDPASRLSQLTQEMAGTANDLTLGFAYNPASQIV